MEFPNLIGKRVEEGMEILRRDYGALNVLLSEYTIPEDFRKKTGCYGGKSVRRILGYRYKSDTELELLIAAFNEKPLSSRDQGSDPPPHKF